MMFTVSLTTILIYAFIFKMKKLILFSSLLMFTSAFAQTDSIKTTPFSFSGYGEIYYAYDFANPNNHTRPEFSYSHNRHNEVNLNLGLIKASYLTDNVRANIGLGAGTYMNANYAGEQGVLKNVYEANIGIKLSKSKNIWLDAGVLPSHIGWESAIGKDNWTLTRSLAADNSPYFETGAKVSYTTDSGKWFVSVLVLNGWQRIQRVDGNHTPAFGHQLTYKINDKISLNSSSFIGNDKADSLRQMRYFHNLYGTFLLSKKWAVTAGFDLGAEQKSKGSHQYNAWYSPVLIVKYLASEKSSIIARGEYYDDKNGVIISTGTANGFKTFGYSVNYDYNIAKNVVWRTEARGYTSKDKIFSRKEELIKDNFVLTTALAISF